MIRRATLKDLDDIWILVQLGISEGDLLERSKEEIRKNIHTFFVYEKRGIVGCCALEIYGSKSSEVRSLYVFKKFRGSGVASALIEACLDEAKKKKVKEVFIVSKNLWLLRHLGFDTEYEGRYVSFKIL